MQHHHHHSIWSAMSDDPRTGGGSRARHEGFGLPDDLDPRARRRRGGRGPWGPEGGGHRPEDSENDGWGHLGPAGFRPDRAGREDGADPRTARGRGGFGPGFGPGGGPGFGPGAGPFDPEGDPRRGGGFRRGRGRGRGPHRAPRGDVRTAVLLLLAEEPMHGYQLMQTIAERTGGRWSPSPGAIYPTLSQLEDEGLVDTTKEGGRKLASLTEAGRTHVEENRASWADPFPQAATDADENTVDLRTGLRDLTNPIRDLVRSGSDAQIRAAATVLDEARRSLYRILAGDQASSASESAPTSGDHTPEDPAPRA